MQSTTAQNLTFSSYYDTFALVFWGALIALGEQSKCVNLADEIGHASPATEPKSDHKNPHNHKAIDCVMSHPSS